MKTCEEDGSANPATGSARAALPLDGDLVISFRDPHQPGTVFDTSPGTIYGLFGEPLPCQPLFIVAEATEEDWRRCAMERGNPSPCRYPEDMYFYFVRTD